MRRIVWKILRTGILTEPVYNLEKLPEVARIHHEILHILGRALCIRQVDAGSCNGCELEIHALNNPYYNLEGYGIKFVASPRHADLLMVTGPVSRNMEMALKRGVTSVEYKTESAISRSEGRTGKIQVPRATYSLRMSFWIVPVSFSRGTPCLSATARYIA